MDYDELFNEANDSTNFTEYVYHSTPTEIVLECVRFLACFIGTTFDILMIYIIVRNKNMQKPVNIYILNWLICDALFIMADPTEYRLYSILLGFEATWDVICIMFTGLLIMRTLDILFMFILMLYWFFDKTKVVLFERHCHRVVISVWVLGLFEFVAMATPCMVGHAYSYMGEVFLAVVVLVYIVSFLIIHCKRRCSNPFSSTSSLPVALLTSFVLCWAIMIAINFAFRLFDRHVYNVVFFMGQLAIYTYPIVLFYLFYKLDHQFATCARVLFKRSNAEDADACCDENDDDNTHTGENHRLP